MNDLENIERQMLERIRIKKDIEREIKSIQDYSNGMVRVPYALKFDLKNIKCSILVLKFFYYLEENRNILPKEQLSPIYQIKDLILNDYENSSYIKELMMLEIGTSGVRKEDFVKHFFASLIANYRESHVNQAYVIGVNEEKIREQLEDFENSFESKEKIQIILDFLKEHKINDKKQIQRLLFKVLELYKNKNIEPETDFDLIIFEYFFKNLPYTSNKRVTEETILENYKTMHTIFNYLKISV